jgi:hypothetical protein
MGTGEMFIVQCLMAAPYRACIRSAHGSIVICHLREKEKKSPSTDDK